ncbi:hypothetical protein BGX38DRAFT_1278031 [Terfezia claveryi]|nr:hypothetical protein BGX38DRAFT_1278031 [Terfezia claveryi]
MGNIKKAWKDMKAMQARLRWEIKSEKNEESINEILDQRCPYFWHLEEIWGSGPNVSVVLQTESIAPELPPKPAIIILMEEISQRPMEAEKEVKVKVAQVEKEAKVEIVRI